MEKGSEKEHEAQMLDYNLTQSGCSYSTAYIIIKKWKAARHGEKGELRLKWWIYDHQSHIFDFQTENLSFNFF